MGAFLSTYLLPIASLLVGASGAFFAARSYYMDRTIRRQDQDRQLKRMLVGSAETSVQNLTEVIENLRTRIDRQNKKIENLTEEQTAKSDRIDDLIEERERLQSVVDRLSKQNQRLIERAGLSKGTLEVPKETVWSDAPFKPPRD